MRTRLILAVLPVAVIGVVAAALLASRQLRETAARRLRA